MTEEEAQPGARVRASLTYYEHNHLPFGASGTIVGPYQLHGEQHLTIRWDVPGEGRQITGGVNISRGELADLYVFTEER